MIQGSQALNTWRAVGSASSGAGGLTSLWLSSEKRGVGSVMISAGFHTRRNSTMQASEMPPAATSTMKGLT